MITEIRCSSLYRAMQCFGPLLLENLVHEEAGQPAKDGTAVGELLSEMIRQRTDSPKIGTTASNGTFLDQDMWFHARDTYNTILQRAQGNPIETEERIDWMTPAGIKIRGQFDVSFRTQENEFLVLNVPDLKFGYGIVEVKENWQLIGYAIGQCQRQHAQGLPLPQLIRLTIIQPRPYHEDGRIRDWLITFDELIQYYNQICERMQAYVNGSRTLETGKACKYCNAGSTCPALNRSANKAIDTVLCEWSEKPLTNEEVAEQYELLQRAHELLELRLKSVEQLAISRIQANQIIPGYAFEMTYGDRKWKSNVTPESIHALTGVTITKTEMLSPNQAEKAGVSKKLTSVFTEKPAKGVKLVKKDVAEEANKILPKPY